MRPASSPDRPTASGPCTLIADDDVAVDLADEHHAGDVERLGVGDPQAVAELGLLAEPRHELADLRAAAVHDDRLEPDRRAAARRPRRRPGRAPGRPWRCRRTSRRPPRPGSAGCTAAPRRARRPARRRRPSPAARPRSGTPACSRGPHVLVDVGVGEVVGEDRAAPSPTPRSQVNSRSLPGQVGRDRRRVVVDPRRSPGDDGAAVGDRDGLEVEGDAGGAELARAPGPSTGLRRTRSTSRAGSSATLRAAASASSSVAAPVTRDLDDLGVALGVAAPSAWRGRRRPSATAAANAAGRAAPARPLASTSTVSLVDVQPSTHGVEAVGHRRPAAPCAARPARRPASVVSTASIVAMLGASIAAPLAMPPTAKPSPRDHGLLATVSVVMIASAAACRRRLGAPGRGDGGDAGREQRPSAAGCR